MGKHVRQQVREEIAGILVGLSNTSDRVFTSRVYPIQETDLPCLMIKTEQERVDYQTVNKPAQQEREITLVIEAIAKANEALDNTLDDICKEVEIVMDTVAVLTRDIQLAGTNIELSVLGNQPIGQATMIYRMKVYTESNSPDVFL